MRFDLDHECTRSLLHSFAYSFDNRYHDVGIGVSCERCALSVRSRRPAGGPCAWCSCARTWSCASCCASGAVRDPPSPPRPRTSTPKGGSGCSSASRSSPLRPRAAPRRARAAARRSRSSGSGSTAPRRPRARAAVQRGEEIRIFIRIQIRTLCFSQLDHVTS